MSFKTLEHIRRSFNEDLTGLIHWQNIMTCTLTSLGGKSQPKITAILQYNCVLRVHGEETVSSYHNFTVKYLTK